MSIFKRQAAADLQADAHPTPGDAVGNRKNQTDPPIAGQTKIAKRNKVAKPAKHANRPPITFAEWFVVLNGCLPLAFLAWDAWRHQLGADPIRRGIHITGVMALLLLLITLCITPLRRLTKQNGLHGYRRPLGMVAFLYACAHLSIYVAIDHRGQMSDVGQELLSRRYLQFGFIAWLLIVPLAVTSTPRMIRWLTMRRWRVLHRLIYPSVIFATVHLAMQSKVSPRLQAAAIVATTLLLSLRLADWLAGIRSRRSVMLRTKLP